MCDSTGQDGFGAFDNALILWGGGNPGSGCGHTQKESNRKVRDVDETSDIIPFLGRARLE